MRLYHLYGSRSARVRWLLEELELPYELVDLDPSSPRSAEHLRAHPHGSVPALVDGEDALIESGAILLALADAHLDRGLAPAPGAADRARYYQWILYATATIDHQLTAIWAHTSRLPEARRDPEQLADALARFGVAQRVIGEAVRDRPFLLGERLTAADIAVGWCLGFARWLGHLSDEPALRAYWRRLAERPAFKRAYAPPGASR